MSSINLLPEKIKNKKNKERQKSFFFAFSALLLVISVLSYLGAYINKTTAFNKSEELGLEMKKVSVSIEKEIENNELFLTKSQIKDIAEILDSHSYFSKAFGVVQSIIVDGVYLEDSSLSFDEENLIMEISGVADNYPAVVNQIAIFKNSYWIDKVEINEISLGEKGDVSFSGSLKIKNDAVLFYEDYWNFGLALLSSKVDRYLKINEYSAQFKKAVGDEEKLVEVEFSGIAYDTEKLISFEDDLKQIDIFVKDVSISYDLNKKNDDNAIDFKGKMELNMP
ncbi:MAG: PilN domain-containing protein [Patescibacteria group bacterium]|nr:PilN domain-containing protein [Patescibacteria group bacterium]